MKELNEFLKTVAILEPLADDEIGQFANSLVERSVRDGDVLFNQGDRGETLYIVREGEIAGIIELTDGTRRDVARFSVGDFFGDMAIFENDVRSATCIACTDSTLLELHKSDFFHLIEENPAIAIKIMYRMLNITTGRLQNTGQFLSEMIRWGNDARKRAITDEFTGVYNRRFLEESMGPLFAEAVRKKTPISLVMIDLDHFREINDTYGHDMGDSLILELVTVCKRNLREHDIIARYGGDEFSIIFPGTGREEAMSLAEKMRSDAAGLDILEKKEGAINRVTLSMGVAAYPDGADSLSKLKSKADEALYRAKEEGRDRVVFAD